MNRWLATSLGLFGTLLTATPGVGAQATQINFAAPLTGGAVFPPVLTPAAARSTFTLDLTTAMLWYRIETSVGTPVTLAGLFMAPLGAPGPLVMPLPVGAGGPVLSGVTPPLPPLVLAALYAGGLYIQIGTVAFPAGELRGQLSRAYHRNLVAAFGPLPLGMPVGAGLGNFVLNVPENRLMYWIEIPGFAPPLTSASLNFGGPGVFGPPIVPLTGDGLLFCGITPELPAPVVAAILAGGTHVEIIAPAFVGGGLRGDVALAVDAFTAMATGAQETPPNPSPATGYAQYVLAPGVAGYLVAGMSSWIGGPSILTATQMGAPGVAGPAYPPLMPWAGPVVGPWFFGAPPIPFVPLTPLFTSMLYFEIDSPPFPLGEVRGQFIQNPDYVGYPGPVGAGALADNPRILGLGMGLGTPPFPIPGGTFNVAMVGGPPLALAALALADDTIGMPLDLTGLGMEGCVLFVDIIDGVVSATNAFGCVAPVVFVIPPVPALVGTDYYLQWLVVDPPANPLGLTTSDSMRVVIQM